MIKRILVALDRNEDTPLATRYAINIAKAFNASLTGLASVDLPTINSVVGGGGIGTIHFARQLKSQLTKDSRQAAETLLKNFKRLVEASDLAHSKFMFEGVPHDRIIEESKYHDLVVIGRKSHFFDNRPELETKTLASIVKKGTGPTLMVTEEYRPIKRVVIAHDGSKASACALQWFIQLEPFGRDIEIDIVFACNKEKKETADKGEQVLSLAYDYLEVHGYTKMNKVLLHEKGGAAKQVIIHVNETGSDLVVIGAHSSSAIRRLTFGSVTRELVKNSPVPLFMCS